VVHGSPIKIDTELAKSAVGEKELIHQDPSTPNQLGLNRSDSFHTLVVARYQRSRQRILATPSDALVVSKV
jgi:hypothetical protein